MKIAQFYNIDLRDEKINRNLNIFSTLVKNQIKARFYRDSIQRINRMTTANTFAKQFQNLSQFPEITYTKLNKHYVREINSIYKMRAQSYNFRKELQDRHYHIDNPYCKCGEYDTFDHIMIWTDFYNRLGILILGTQQFTIRYILINFLENQNSSHKTSIRVQFLDVIDGIGRAEFKLNKLKKRE